MNQGERFRDYRQKARLNQKEASELLGVTPFALCNYEKNRNEPNIGVLKKMSALYGVSIDELVDNDIKINPSDKTDKNREEVFQLIDEYSKQIKQGINKIESKK